MSRPGPSPERAGWFWTLPVLLATFGGILGAACSAPTAMAPVPAEGGTRPAVDLAAPLVDATEPALPPLIEHRIPGVARLPHPEGWPAAPLPIDGFDTVLLFVDPAAAGLPGSEQRLAFFHRRPADRDSVDLDAADLDAADRDDTDRDLAASATVLDEDSLASFLDAMSHSGIVADGYQLEGDLVDAELAGQPALEALLFRDGLDDRGQRIDPDRRALLRAARLPEGDLIGWSFEAEAGVWTRLEALRQALLEGVTSDEPAAP